MALLLVATGASAVPSTPIASNEAVFAIHAPSKMRVLIIDGKGMLERGQTEASRLQCHSSAVYSDYKKFARDSARELGIDAEIRQSDIETEVVGWVRAAALEGFDAMVMNPGGFLTSAAVGAAVGEVGIPIFEVHYSNVVAHGYLTTVGQNATGVFYGNKLLGYRYALMAAAATATSEWTQFDYPKAQPAPPPPATVPATVLATVPSTVLGQVQIGPTEAAASPPVVMGTVVMGTVVSTVGDVAAATAVPISAASSRAEMAVGGASSSVPSGVPPLIDIVNLLKRELGLEGNVAEVISRACKELGISPEGKSLTDQAKECWMAVTSRKV